MRVKLKEVTVTNGSLFIILKLTKLHPEQRQVTLYLIFANIVLILESKGVKKNQNVRT